MNKSKSCVLSVVTNQSWGVSTEGRKGSWARLMSTAGSRTGMKQLEGPLGTTLGAAICVD